MPSPIPTNVASFSPPDEDLLLSLAQLSEALSDVDINEARVDHVDVNNDRAIRRLEMSVDRVRAEIGNVLQEALRITLEDPWRKFLKTVEDTAWPEDDEPIMGWLRRFYHHHPQAIGGALPTIIDHVRVENVDRWYDAVMSACLQQRSASASSGRMWQDWMNALRGLSLDRREEVGFKILQRLIDDDRVRPENPQNQVDSRSPSMAKVEALKKIAIHQFESGTNGLALEWSKSCLTLSSQAVDWAKALTTLLTLSRATTHDAMSKTVFVDAFHERAQRWMETWSALEDPDARYVESPVSQDDDDTRWTASRWSDLSLWKATIRDRVRQNRDPRDVVLSAIKALGVAQCVPPFERWALQRYGGAKIQHDGVGVSRPRL